MNEENFDTNKQQEPFDLEKCLRAYYGPPLPEQPLSASSWHNLHLRLGPQEDAGWRYRFGWHLPPGRSRAAVPTSTQDAFARIAYEARVPYRPSMLRCSLKPQGHEPAVRCSWLGRRKIRLMLPIHVATMMGQAELDTLL